MEEKILYSPISYYIIKKLSKFDDTNVEAKLEHERQLKSEWISLDDKKHLKFIKKAERDFDDNHAFVDRDCCLSKYLTIQELEILLKSYGMPDRIPDTLKQYYYKKSISEGVTFTETTQKFTKLAEDEKHILINDYCQLEEDYAKQFSDFLNSLPEQRLIDYRFYVTEKNVYNIPGTKKETPKKETPKKDHIAKDPKILLPHDYFYNKNIEKYGDLSFSSKNKARSDYSNLIDSEKLYYIKKFEKFYDNNEEIFLNENGEKLKLGFLLAKTELDILFQNYGLPKPVPMSFFNYFVFYPNVEKTKESYNQGVLSARNAYKSLTPTELEEIKKNHRRDLAEYWVAKAKFEADLPENRQEDYEIYLKKAKTNKKTKKTSSQLELNGNLNGSDMDREHESESNTDVESSPKKKTKKK